MLIITKPDQFHPGALCEVVSETEKQYTVKIIQASTSWGSAANVIGEHSYRGPRVNKDCVLAVDVTELTYIAYRAAHERRAARIQAMHREVQAQYEETLKGLFGED